MSQRHFSQFRRAISDKLTASKSKRRRPGGRRNLAFESLETRQLLSITTLQNFSVSENTGEKPQSKVFEYNDQWYAVMPDSGATWLWRLDGTQWTQQLAIAQNDKFHADVKVVDNLAHILLFDKEDSQLATLEYDHGPDNRYEMWSLRPQLVNVPLSGSTETAALEVDSTGRMWIVSDPGSNVEVRYSDGLYTNWSSSFIVGSGMNSDDIASIVAMPNGSIGVMWSNQSTDRFYFRTHVDGANATQWSTTEVAAPLAARSNMSDDHINLAVASDGTLYAAVKTSLSNPKMVLLVRRPNGVWDNWYPVDSGGTRPIVVINEAAGKLLFAYTSSDSGGNIYYKESPLGNISFGPRQTLISGSLNNASSVKAPFLDEVVVIAAGGSSVRSAMFRFDSPVVNTPPVVNAGPDQVIQFATGTTLVGSISDDGRPTNGSLTAGWSIVTAPGVVNFGSPTSAQTSVTFSAVGSYVLRLTGNDGQLQSSDTVTVNVLPPPEPAANQAPLVDAGPNQQIIFGASGSLDGTVSDDGLPAAPGSLTTNWSQIDGPGIVAFGNPSAVDTTATFTAPGDYQLRLTVSDGEFTRSDTVSVSVIQSTEPITAAFQDGLAMSPVYAGTTDTQITAGSPGTNYGTSGVITIDGQSDSAALLRWDLSLIPVGSTIISAAIELNIVTSSTGNYELYALERAWNELAATWEQAAANTPWSTGGADGVGDYLSTPIGQLNPNGANGIYQMSLNNAGLAAVQAWINDPANNFGLVIKDYAEADTTSTVTTTTTVRRGRGSSTVTQTQQVVDPVQIVFSSREALDVALRPKLILNYEPDQGSGPPAPINTAPVVNAGTDQQIQLPGNASLSGSVTDDGLPAASLTRQWSVVDGPGTVSFANQNAAATTASFSTAGTYTLRLTGSDGALSNSDDVVIQVLAAPPVNQAPLVNAGLDQTIQLPNSASLSGTVTDDGLPGAPLTRQWSVVDGPGTVNFTNPNAASTTASFSTAGTYTLRLTGSDGALSRSDDVMIEVIPAMVPTNVAPLVNVGPNQSIELPNAVNLSGSVSDDGLPTPSSLTLLWTASGPGNVTFGNASSANTTAQFSTAGTYTLRLTANDGELAAFAELTVTVTDPPVTPPADPPRRRRGR